MQQQEGQITQQVHYSNISLVDIRPDVGKRLPTGIVDSIHKHSPPDEVGKLIQRICGME